ncbi:MAG TPA: site-specific DNA-methyltransferase [Pyrinomonadaceae bacterium]|jgi:site-specific DNA-methyltransferase (adenine-specific)
MTIQIHLGDCLEIAKGIPDGTIDLVYLDPPFFTGKVQKLSTRDRTKEFSFSDSWKSADEYADFLSMRLKEFRRVLASTGSIFFHCDTNAAHLVRLLLDEVFGHSMFRAEIIWHYRRWSNSHRSLMPSHQTIYFYSKTDSYKFNTIYEGYSPSTNVDQILQKRKRDEFGKSVYARDENGNPISNGDKKGVPIGDVWDIPLLNPKAKERVGYPTQKPILLLERIIQISTDEGDTVFDPFCGSGTTLLATELLNRNGIGIDISSEAIKLTRERLENPVKSKSHLMDIGRDAYRLADEGALSHLKGLDFVPVQRNFGIDAFLKVGLDSGSIPVRVQREGESLIDAASALHKAAKTKKVIAMILVATQMDLGFDIGSLFPEVIIVDTASNAIGKVIRDLKRSQ